MTLSTMNYLKTIKKAVVEVPIIEEIMSRMKGRSRWIPHNGNPVDGLTKLKGAHLEPLLQLLLTGSYHLKTEEAQLKARADAKEKRWSNTTVQEKWYCEDKL